MRCPRGVATGGLPWGGACAPLMAALVCTALCWSTAGCGPGRAIVIQIDAAGPTTPVSPYVYGIDADSAEAPDGVRLQRFGDRRWTTYNWETNASNGGSAEGHRNDGRLSESDSPGAAVAARVLAAWRQGDAALVTVPLVGWVSGDKAGPVREGAPRELRFHRSLARNPSAFGVDPDPDDQAVYQDEFVHWAQTVLGAGPDRPLWFALDYQPDLWPQAHPRVHSAPTRYDELAELAVEYASAIKSVAPDTLVFAPGVSGYAAAMTLRDAPDALGRGAFLPWYLEQLSEGRRGEARRLVDVIDVHHLSEARADDDTRVTFGGAEDHGPAVAQARLHAARSLYDPTYAEDSPLVQDRLDGEPLALLPRLRATLAEHKPEAQLAIGAYSFGGAGHISGGVAQAEALGAMASQGVFASSWRRMENRFGLLDYVMGAFALYTDYNGQGAGFGDRALATTTESPDKIAAFASLDSDRPDVMVAVLINRTDSSQRVELDFAGGFAWSRSARFEMRDGQPAPAPGRGEVRILEKTGGTRLVLPPVSVTVLELSGGAPLPEIAGVADARP
ncbi:MAG: glycoside hydrolase family 44 protein [Planctomycetota bacterium]